MGWRRGVDWVRLIGKWMDDLGVEAGLGDVGGFGGRMGDG